MAWTVKMVSLRWGQSSENLEALPRAVAVSQGASSTRTRQQTQGAWYMNAPSIGTEFQLQLWRKTFESHCDLKDSELFNSVLQRQKN